MQGRHPVSHGRQPSGRPEQGRRGPSAQAPSPTPTCWPTRRPARLRPRPTRSGLSRRLGGAPWSWTNRVRARDRRRASPQPARSRTCSCLRANSRTGCATPPTTATHRRAGAAPDTKINSETVRLARFSISGAYYCPWRARRRAGDAHSFGLGQAHLGNRLQRGLILYVPRASIPSSWTARRPARFERMAKMYQPGRSTACLLQASLHGMAPANSWSAPHPAGAQPGRDPSSEVDSSRIARSRRTTRSLQGVRRGPAPIRSWRGPAASSSRPLGLVRAGRCARAWKPGHSRRSSVRGGLTGASCRVGVVRPAMTSPCSVSFSRASTEPGAWPRIARLVGTPARAQEGLLLAAATRADCAWREPGRLSSTRAAVRMSEPLQGPAPSSARCSTTRRTEPASRRAAIARR